jgi:hypothetical protein
LQNEKQLGEEMLQFDIDLLQFMAGKVLIAASSPIAHWKSSSDHFISTRLPDDFFKELVPDQLVALCRMSG